MEAIQSVTWYAFSEGSAGDPPAPAGDPPGGMAVMSGCEQTVPFRSMPLPVPSGESPDGTGESPVLPTLNTNVTCEVVYRFGLARSQAQTDAASSMHRLRPTK